MNDEQFIFVGNDPDEFKKISMCIWSNDQNSLRFVGVLNTEVMAREVEAVLNI